MMLSYPAKAGYPVRPAFEINRNECAAENWTARPERDLAVAYIFWTARANVAMISKKYSQSEQLAARSIKMHADQPGAWELQAQAEFAEAAGLYRQICDVTRP